MRPPFQLSRRLPFGVIAPIVESFTGLKTLNKLYKRSNIINEEPEYCARNVLNLLNITYTVKTGNYKNIPKNGPLIVVANHPFGGVEGLILIDMILKIRKDVKVLANEILGTIKELDQFFIGVNVLKKTGYHKANWLAINEAAEWVQNGGVLILFPSGEVASWQWRHKTVMEAPWQKTIARLIQLTQAEVLPIFFEGSNSPVFHSLGFIHERARTLWLARELINKRNNEIFLHVGETIDTRNLSRSNDKNQITNYLCLATLLLGYKNKKNTSGFQHVNTVGNDHQQTIGFPIDKNKICHEIGHLDQELLLLEKNEFQVWCVPADKIPLSLQEIGYLREVAFREVGEGSGNSIDIDEFDQYYHHLFMWNQDKKEIVGAYRIGHVDHILKEKGIAALYSQSLFGYQKTFIDGLKHPALELGRSFIRKEYQQDISTLFFLWQGICAYLVKNIRYCILFGAVSISNSYTEVSRQLITRFLTTNHYDRKLAASVNPVAPYKLNEKAPWATQQTTNIKQSDWLSTLVKTIEKNKGIPILLKHYLKLNGKFVGFNVDKNFNNVVDGLIVVNLAHTERRILSRYMGKEKLALYLKYHNYFSENICVENSV